MAGCRQFLIFQFIIWYFSPFFFSQFDAPNAIMVTERYDRIVGGEDANITDFPYQLSLEINWGSGFRHACGGVVMNNNWALTAAHCVNRMESKDIRFRSGTSYRQTNGDLHEVLEIIVHPKFNSTSKDYDVAVVKVTEPFRYSDTVKPIPLAHNTPAAGTPIVVTGWGTLQYMGALPMQLQKVTLNVVDWSECYSSYGGNNRITPRMLCTRDPQGVKQACKGDSGGPLVAHGQLVAVVSKAIRCAEGIPSAHADVAYLRHWILLNAEIN